MNVTPDEQQLWEGIGGHFDSFTQVISEFVDNSIANFEGNDTPSTQVLLTIERESDGVHVRVEDTGTGIDDLEPALRLGDRSIGDAPLNEHGFGMKHALASANPGNDDWRIYTRTADEFKHDDFRLVSAPYRFDLSSETVPETEKRWPGRYNGSGTVIEFTTTNHFFDTVQQGVRGSAGFERCLEYLREDLGFTYSGVIEDGRVSISIQNEAENGTV